MVNSNVEVKKQRKSSVLGGISIGFAVILAVLALNFLTGLILLDKLEGLPIVMPLVLAPIGAIIGLIGYRINKCKLSLWGIIFNILMFLVPIFYNIFGTLIFGV
jgi:ABC-type polysaccharide/polyol phosphate export permease